MTLPPAAAVITRLKFGGMRAAMVVLPARSWGQIAADERLYDFCRLVASLQRVALLAGAQGAWRRAARKCCYGPCCRKEREIEARKAATSQLSPLKRSLAL